MDIADGIRLTSGRNNRGFAEYEQVRGRIIRSCHNAMHKLDTLGPVGCRANAKVPWGQSAAEQMQKWQQALQADQITDAGLKRVSPLSAFQVTETNEGGMMVITTTRVTQMHDIVKSL